MVSDSPFNTSRPTNVSSERDAPVASKVGGGVITQGEAEEIQRKRRRSRSRSKPEVTSQPKPPMESKKSTPLSSNISRVSGAAPSFNQLAQQAIQEQSKIESKTKSTKPSFFSAAGQRQAGARVAQQFEVIGKRTANVFLPKSKEFELQTQNVSNLDKLASNPAFIFGAPAVAAGAAVAGVGTAVTTGTARVAASPVGQTFSRLAAIEKTNRATRLIGLGVKVEAGTTAIKGGTDLIASQRLTPEQRAIINQDKNLFRESLRSGFQSQRVKADEQGFLRSIGNELSPFFGSRQAFEKGVREKLEQSNLQQNEIDKLTQAALSRRTSRGFGELGGQLITGAAAEKLGRFGITQAFQVAGTTTTKKSFFDIAKRTAPSLFAAGVLEGGEGVRTQAKFREEPFNLKRVAGGALFGGASAAALGIPITGLALSKPAISKTISFGANILDPLEKPSDILADVSETASRRLLGQQIKSPTITSDDGNFFRFGTQTRGPRKLGRQDVEDLTLINAQRVELGQPIITPTLTDSKTVSSPTKRRRRTTIFSDAVVIPSFDIAPKVDPFTKNAPIEDPTKIITDTQTQTPSNPFSFSRTNINIKSTVPAFSIGVPVFSSVAKAPPPFLPPAGFGLNSGKGRTKFKGSKFINELEQAFKLIGGSAPKQNVMPKTKGKQKRVDSFGLLDDTLFGSSKAKKSQGFNIPNLGFNDILIKSQKRQRRGF